MGMLGWADQVICAKNATRIQLNQKMRKDLYEWEDPLPQPGDKIICLRNNWEWINPAGDNLVNGLTGYIDDITYKTRECFCYSPSMFATFTPDYIDKTSFEDVDINSFRNTRMDRKIFMEGEPFVNSQNFSKIPRQFKPNEFDYGYAITCHKAQGSEFDKVLVFEEFMKGDTSEKHRRWLYTAVTRAAKKLVLVKA
jgi:exodeoxyribonuclease-5